ncbi:hypothetical protein EE612_021962 [Oryza sativa]|nr:hypothetical protein EE612_021962 [Oryza sativa]
MAVFDQRDEEDDFDGVEHGARGVIPLHRCAGVRCSCNNGTLEQKGTVDIPGQVWALDQA